MTSWTVRHFRKWHQTVMPVLSPQVRDEEVNGPSSVAVRGPSLTVRTFGVLPSPRVFLAGEEPAFNILFVGHPTPANLSERLARTGHPAERHPPRPSHAAATLSLLRCGRQKAGAWCICIWRA